MPLISNYIVWPGGMNVKPNDLGGPGAVCRASETFHPRMSPDEPILLYAETGLEFPAIMKAK
jgi:hypothetical protein